jgi:phosphopantothenoylcysteine decarboxylase/phosphopantothenate--cysteine ligase
VEVVRVETAAEMEAAVLARSDDADVVVLAAAVADFRMKAPATEKLAAADGVPDLILEPTTDIAAEVGRRRRRGQVLVGFAAATGPGEERGLAKLAAKGLDLIACNDVAAFGTGFEFDTNAVVILGADGFRVEVPLASKRAVAAALWDEIVRRLPSKLG